ncbi:helix-turn-helix transcriptional regulator [Nocardia sp. NPDC052566]|uniref:helix-turn-helix transcriptional regulator n=1 Tax=Nocardia sp. NPDC052566 TaxID=3364330 RepID=UPI0037C60ACA
MIDGNRERGEEIGMTIQDGHATPEQLAQRWHTSTASLAQDRYRGTGPKFLKRGRRVLYPWSEIVEWEASHTVSRTDDSSGSAAC